MDLLLTSDYTSLMEDSAKKANRIRIVLLKEAPTPIPLYDHHRSKNRITHSHDATIVAKPKANRNSIAYLSSILQDEHLQTEKSTVHVEDNTGEVGEEEEGLDKLEKFRRSGKKSNRYLSCLLETADDGEQPHAKTQGIQKLLRRRKIMPIDKLQQRRKNITFSLKNKRQLNQEFHQFVSKKTALSIHPPTHNVDERETISFVNRKQIMTEKRVATLRGDKKKGRKVMQHLQFLEENLPLPPHILKKGTNLTESKEPGYAIAFKRLSSDIPQINSFEWSRLDANAYQLINK